MELNLKKCGVLFINDVKKNEREFKDLIASKLKVPIVQKYKYLGIEINNKFQPVPHIEKLKQASEKFGQVIKILNFKASPLKLKLELFKTLIL
jgi:hypothetical protein